MHPAEELSCAFFGAVWSFCPIRINFSVDELLDGSSAADQVGEAEAESAAVESLAKNGQTDVGLDADDTHDFAEDSQEEGGREGGRGRGKRCQACLG